MRWEALSPRKVQTRRNFVNIGIRMIELYAKINIIQSARG